MTMKNLFPLIGMWITLGLLAGCSKDAGSPAANPPAASGPTAQPAAAIGNALGSVKVGDQALCAICVVNDGTTAKEEVKATLDYKGKTYAFCSEDEKAEFISSPARYAGGQ
jgi:YHS domain-containing protein